MLCSLQWQTPKEIKTLHQPSELVSSQIHMRPRKKKMETILGSRAEVVNSANAPELILGAWLENQGGLKKDSVYTK